MAKTHELKIFPEYYEAVAKGYKTFELRKDDREYQVGDGIILKEWDWEKEKFTGRQYEGIIIYILRDCEMYGLKDGYCIFGFIRR